MTVGGLSLNNHSAIQLIHPPLLEHRCHFTCQSLWCQLPSRQNYLSLPKISTARLCCRSSSRQPMRWPCLDCRHSPLLEHRCHFTCQSLWCQLPSRQNYLSLPKISTARLRCRSSS